MGLLPAARALLHQGEVPPRTAGSRGTATGSASGGTSSSRFAAAPTGGSSAASTGAIPSTSSSPWDANGVTRSGTGSVNRGFRRLHILPSSWAPSSAYLCGDDPVRLAPDRARPAACVRPQAGELPRGAAGLALLLVVGSIAIRLPGEETTFAVIGAVLVIASAVFLNTRSEAILGHAVGIGRRACPARRLLSVHRQRADRDPGGTQQRHGLAPDLRRVPARPEPPRSPGIQIGYPIGPHSLAVTAATTLGSEPLRGFLGLLVALPVLTAITSLGALRELPRPPDPRRAARLQRLPDRVGARDRRVQGADRLDVPARLRPRPARDRTLR